MYRCPTRTRPISSRAASNVFADSATRASISSMERPAAACVCVTALPESAGQLTEQSLPEALFLHAHGLDLREPADEDLFLLAEPLRDVDDQPDVVVAARAPRAELLDALAPEHELLPGGRAGRDVQRLLAMYGRNRDLAAEAHHRVRHRDRDVDVGAV